LKQPRNNCVRSKGQRLNWDVPGKMATVSIRFLLSYSGRLSSAVSRAAKATARERVPGSHLAKVTRGRGARKTARLHHVLLAEWQLPGGIPFFFFFLLIRLGGQPPPSMERATRASGLRTGNAAPAAGIVLPSNGGCHNHPKATTQGHGQGTEPFTHRGAEAPRGF